MNTNFGRNFGDRPEDMSQKSDWPLGKGGSGFSPNGVEHLVT